MSGLSNGQAYSFQVRAVNDQGNALASNVATATPSTVPDPIDDLAAAAVDAQVTLSWSTPDDGGSAITGYDFRQREGYGAGPPWSAWTDIEGSGPATTSHTVTGLDYGTPYSFQVRASNTKGHAGASSEAVRLAFTSGVADVVTWILDQPVELQLPAVVPAEGISYTFGPGPPFDVTFDSDPYARLLSGVPKVRGITDHRYVASNQDVPPDSARLQFSIEVLGPEGLQTFVALPAARGGACLYWQDPWLIEDSNTLLVEARGHDGQPSILASVEADAGRACFDGFRTDAPYTFRLLTPDGASPYASVFIEGSTPGACRTGQRYRCLQHDNFELHAQWNIPDGDLFGHATGFPLVGSDQSTLFSFFSPDNIELAAKVLDGRAYNDSHWIFVGALSDVEWWLTVRESLVGGRQRTYYNPPGEICGQADLEAFVAYPPSTTLANAPVRDNNNGGRPEEFSLRTPLPPNPLNHVTATADQTSATGCSAAADRLCLFERFAVEVRFIDSSAATPRQPEPALVIPETATQETGFFSFFDSENLELAVKVLDGRWYNGNFWLLYGGLSDAEYWITVTDTTNGATRQYHNPPKQICGTIDPDAF